AEDVERLHPRHDVRLVSREAHALAEREPGSERLQRFALRPVAHDHEHRILRLQARERAEQVSMPLPAAKRGDDAHDRAIGRKPEAGTSGGALAGTIALEVDA